jgi:hypothetical protein
MGLFPLAATISSMLNPLRAIATRSRWPEAPWRPSDSYMHQRTLPHGPSRSAAPRSLFQSRAITSQSLHRASQSIQRDSFRRKCSQAGTTLRRWMLPTVERGPPATLCV